MAPEWSLEDTMFRRKPRSWELRERTLPSRRQRFISRLDLFGWSRFGKSAVRDFVLSGIFYFQLPTSNPCICANLNGNKLCASRTSRGSFLKSIGRSVDLTRTRHCLPDILRRIVVIVRVYLYCGSITFFNSLGNLVSFSFHENFKRYSSL